MHLLLAYIAGLTFGLGIIISGMINPAKVLNFFDIFGTFDPSLLCVIGAALPVAFIGYRLVFKRAAPLYFERFDLPETKKIDIRLITGSVLFGIGWGIAGFCPGGALPALGTGRSEVFSFMIALGLGIGITRLFLQRGATRSTSKPLSVTVK